MTTLPPLDWISQVETSLVELDAKPQFELPFPFNWHHFEDAFQNLMGYQDLKVTHLEKGWISPDRLFSGLGEHLLTLAIDWTPIEVPAYFVVEHQAIKDLMGFLFKSDEVTNYFYDSGYVTGFYTYFAAEVLKIIDSQQFASPLSVRLGAPLENVQEKLREQACFVIDIGISFEKKTLWGRILLSESFRTSWKKFFFHLPSPSLSEDMKNTIQIEASLEIAYAHLKLKEWQEAKTGDFVILDDCSYEPEARQGNVVITLNQKPVFAGYLKKNAIKITNYPVYEEASDAMEKSFDESYNSDDEEEDLFDDIDDEEDDEFDQEESEFDEEEESEFEEDEESEFDDADTQFEEDEDFNVDEQDADNILTGLEPPKKNLSKTEKKDKTKVQLTADEEGPTISAHELPIRLTVEIGRIRMNIGDLMKLSPGNLLDLNVAPEQGVDLVINGKKVGRGELIRMGEVLGVRILSL